MFAIHPEVVVWLLDPGRADRADRYHGTDVYQAVEDSIRK
jgi:hypothetical protein